MTQDETPYARFTKKNLILRDELAIDRTVLANERTLLSYVRTALTFGVVAATCFKFFDSLSMDLFGLLFTVIALFLLGFGALRSRQTYLRIQQARQRNKDEDNLPVVIWADHI
jgi:putative membrane protein